MDTDQQGKEEKEEGKQQQNNEQCQEGSKEEEEEKKAGHGFGGNLDININIRRQKRNLDGANDRTTSRDDRTQHYLDSLLRKNDVSLRGRLEKAIGDYFDENERYPDANYGTLTWFVIKWLDLVDVPPCDLRNLMHGIKELREKDDDAETVYSVALKRMGMMPRNQDYIWEEDYFLDT
ncbi:hypothetical protein WN943_018359 [Citrus x changshan-huyou]